MVAPIHCQHRLVDHFVNPFCPQWKTIKKVGVVVLHFFTFGISWLIARAIQGHGKKQEAPPVIQEAPPVIRVEESVPEKSAMEFAMSLLPDDIKSMGIPVQIDRLIESREQLRQVYYRALVGAKDLLDSQDRWNDQRVIDAADRYMKICYAIGVLTLEALKNAEPNDPIKRQNLLFNQSETEPIYFSTFFYCSEAYESLKDARMRSWNWLYNDYCDRVHDTLPNLGSDHDQRYIQAVRKDPLEPFVAGSIPAESL